MNKLEELLNKLIEKGWKPRWKNYGVIDFLGVLVFVELNDWRLQRKNALDLRKLVSKESWLWQFVCKNGMCKYVGGDRAKNYDEYANECDDCYSCDDYGYRLIESALCDEDKLEEFLLDNIKIDG